MADLAKRDPNWLAKHDDSTVRELTLQLIAEGKTNATVAERLRKSALVMHVTPEDIAYYREANAEEISHYADKNWKTLANKAVRTRRGFRVGELDHLLGVAIEKIHQLLEANEIQKATALMKVYLQGTDSLQKDMGDLSSAGDQQNRFIQLLQQASPDKKEELMRHLAALERIASEIGTRGLPDPHVIDAQFESKDG